MEANLIKYVDEEFDKNLLPALMHYVTIPNMSPDYDPEWETNGHAQKACDHIVSWIKSQNLAGCTVEVLKEPGVSHLIVVEVEGTDKTALMYAHWDKQPPLEGLWDEGLGPFKPVVKGDLLYGRGTADDGYGSFAAVLAVKACQAMKIPHPRIVMVLESAEESGRDDLRNYLEKLMKTKLQKVDYVLCLDSSAAHTDRLWMAGSLRGVLTFDMSVNILKDSVHSGDAGGIVPETFRICRILLDRLEKNGKVIEDFHVEIPESRRKETEQLAALFGTAIYSYYPWLPGAKPETENVTELLLNRCWRPSLAIVGAEGLPELSKAGNVLRASTTLRLSMRIPPTLNAKKASDKIIEILTKDPPYGAEIKVVSIDPCDGWNANEFTPEFKAALDNISKVVFGGEYGVVGVGGSIPFIESLGQKFPKATFMVTGSATSTSSEHAPNENLNLPYTKKFISAMALSLHQATK